MATKRDYYEVLGVERSATEKQISEAYRKLALKHHPDRNPGDEEAIARFKEAAEAFEVLSHPDKRAKYDRYGHAGLENAGAAPHFRDLSEIFEAFGGMFGGDFFSEMFSGGSGRGRRGRRGGDVRCEVVLELEEAAKGVSKTVEFQRHEFCTVCNGSGAKPGTKPESCRYCGGQGRVVQSTGIFSVQTTCPSCRGAGSVVRDPCRECRGAGMVPATVTKSIPIPAGVDTNTRLRVAGEGEPSANGGPRGDCYLDVVVRDHPLFHREGRDLLCQVPITYTQAALGATIEIPTLDGRKNHEIPAGTQSGDYFRLHGLGMPEPRRRGRGDLIVQVVIEVPKRISAEHENLLRQLAEMENAQITPKRNTFFGKLKEYFQSQ